MSFLAPLYLLAGLAIAGPILFHMIRRTPKGRKVFSSVMFLTPSPPRLTKRSRIEDYFLLILRGLAVCLLAFAFSRPFLRAQASSENVAEDTQRIAIVLDTSASMRRAGFWDKARDELRKVLTEARPKDQVVVLAFDSQVREVMSFDDWNSLPPSSRLAAVEAQVEKLKPGWRGTAAGEALVAAADRLEEETEPVKMNKTLVLISDMQAGANWEALNAYTWPEEVVVRLARIEYPQKTTNASLQVVANDNSSDTRVRVRVTNAAGSQREGFQVGWQSEFVPDANPATIFVPAGQSRVIIAPDIAKGDAPQRMGATGDDFDFDNTCYVVRREPQTVKIAYLGPADEPNNPEELRFFLQPMFPSTASRKVEVRPWPVDAAQPDIPVESLSWLIISGDLNPEQLTWTQNWLTKGGEVLFVARNADQSQSLYSLLGIPPKPVVEAEVKNYAMLSRMDLSHPALAIFNDARYSDFTKLKFWQYRRFDAATLPNIKTLATFEDGSPALAQIPAGQGRVTLLSSGWGRRDSELAVWTKFVPLMNSLLETVVDGPIDLKQALVGEKITAKQLELEGDTIHVRIEDEVKSFPAKGDFEFDRPGIYRFAETKDGLANDSARRIAVNLDPRESRTEPVANELLESSGLVMQSQPRKVIEAHEQRRDKQRQLLNRELESRQQVWRWTLIGALALLVVESLYAAWRTRQRAQPV